MSRIISSVILHINAIFTRIFCIKSNIKEVTCKAYGLRVYAIGMASHGMAFRNGIENRKMCMKEGVKCCKIRI